MKQFRSWRYEPVSILSQRAHKLKIDNAQAAFCPPLDPALLSAIISDYDLKNEAAVSEARATLEALKESALLEEHADFDPSGSGAQGTDSSPDKSSHRAESCPDRSASSATDLTSLSNDMFSMDLSGDISGSETELELEDRSQDLSALDEETKLQLLKDLFGKHCNRYSISHTLKKCNGNWTMAMEELLNHVYMEEAEISDGGSRVPMKGIDAFSEDNTARRGRKGKGKQKRFKGLDEHRSSSLPVSPIESNSPTSNKWQTSANDVDFITSRTSLTHKAVSSTYYCSGASIQKTIGVLLKTSISESRHVVSDDSTIQAHATKLGYDFPTIAPDYLTALIRLTHPSTANAHELAKALVTKPSSGNAGDLRVIPRYAPIQLGDGEMSPSTLTGRRSAANSQSPPPDIGAASARVAAYSDARAAALTQARAAYRKSKSDRLMAGAAGYYSQVGRDYSALSATASASAADALAASQSSGNQLDLHGIDVLNGVRIAQQRVNRWWEGLGESRVNGRIGAGARHAGYSIITGVGRHSEGGKSKLGPAVTKMLRSDGWIVEQGSGVLYVKGRAKL